MTSLKPLEVYRQMYRMGPRRSGRSVGNLIAATNAQAHYGQKATVVVAVEQLVDNAHRELSSTLGVPKSLQPRVVTLGNVTNYNGPFFPDHYTTERVIGTFQSALQQAEAQILQLKAEVQELSGRFL